MSRMLGLVAVALLLALPARAEKDFAKVFAEVDSDHDGRISREEWRGPAPRFNKADADRDGFISLEEFVAAKTAGSQGGCSDCEQVWRDCMIGKPGQVKHRCDAVLEQCREGACKAGASED